ncbi:MULTISPECIES: DUF6932 family protein [Calothrix]|uniref:Uncharacterized protein n=2 Tax=Calothrix TaxID=1186 RepID=A0ABR8A863_9CYAN|nr:MULTISPECIES: hypothetical protein [Calothrix]MBD2196182.1 hypothetical protein [Calothrix parietina FACHB-288]MBD2224835.1 hypothetical protein [Calothrix anomala FACHB-343]
MIPEFDENGNLPPGVHFCNWNELKERFGYNLRRRNLINGIEEVLTLLKAARCRTAYLNGSFVTSKLNPQDFDMCWDRDDVDVEYLKKNARLLLNFYNSAAQKARYGGEIYPSDQPVDESIMSIEFFQRDRQQNQKGIIAINLWEWEP